MVVIGNPIIIENGYILKARYDTYIILLKRHWLFLKKKLTSFHRVFKCSEKRKLIKLTNVKRVITCNKYTFIWYDMGIKDLL